MRGRPCKLSTNSMGWPHLGRRDGCLRIAFLQELVLESRTIFRKLGVATFLIGFLLPLVFVNSANAQIESEQPARALVTQGINEGQLITLRGNTRPEANANNDRGAVQDYLP